MIVLRNRRLLIVTPPHVGSGILHEVLCQQHGGIWIQGPNPDGYIDHHTVTIGAGFEQYDVAVVVRNPFDRLIALWYHLVDWTRYHGDGCCGFKEFAGLVAQDNAARLSWMYRYTITRWLSGLRPKYVIRHEDLVNDLRRCMLEDVKLPRRPAPFRRETVSYFDLESAQFVTEWAKNDLRRFGYPELQGICAA